MIDIRPYNHGDSERWNEFVVRSRNGIFLHLRNYMDYHADRFLDFSLIATDERGRWRAILPACRRGSEISSHAGLTFGGWILDAKTDALTMMDVVEASVDFMRSAGCSTLIYKPVPHIYTSYPAEEDLYALTHAGATLSRSMLASVVDMSHPIPFDMAYRQDVRRAQKSGVLVAQATHPEEWSEFWSLLTCHLSERFGAKPVHTIEEISLLRDRFPENIRLYTARKDNQLLGGVVVYHSAVAAHSQYTALSELGRTLRVLPALHACAMDAAAKMGERYFDFGTSADDDSPSGLNEGLVRQKIASGARGVLYNTYTLAF